MIKKKYKSAVIIVQLALILLQHFIALIYLLNDLAITNNKKCVATNHPKKEKNEGNDILGCNVHGIRNQGTCCLPHYTNKTGVWVV